MASEAVEDRVAEHFCCGKDGCMAVRYALTTRCKAKERDWWAAHVCIRALIEMAEAEAADQTLGPHRQFRADEVARWLRAKMGGE